jgi:hypothetical protein
MSETMSAAPASAPEAATPARLNLPYVAIVGAAMGLVAVFTAFAWIPAILVGMIVGRDRVERLKGVRAGGGSRAVRVLAVTGGVLAMGVLGLPFFLFGGFIAFLVAAGASFAERLIADTNPTDQTIGRILIALLTVVIWLVVVNVLKFSYTFSIG